MARQPQLPHCRLKLKPIVTLLFLTLVLMQSPAQGIPFLRDAVSISISVPDSAKLEEELQEFIEEQQASNEQLLELLNQKKKGQYTKLVSALLRKQLKALGYYNFGLSLSEETKDIAFAVQPGPLATIAKIQVNQPEFVFEDLKEIAIQTHFDVGAPLVAKHVISAETRLRAHLENNYCFVNPRLSKSIVLDTSSQEVQIFFNLETEPGKVISEVRFRGNVSITNAFLGNVAKVKKGCFKARNIQRAQIELLKTGLLTSAVSKVIPLKEHEIAIEFAVTERKHRTQSLGFGYSSDERLRLNAGWEHRNWRGNAKNLSVDLKISQIETEFSGMLRIPQFKAPELDLLIDGEVADTSVEAFDSVSAQASSILEYTLNQYWLTSAGVSTEFAKIDTATSEDLFRLLSFPASLRWDSSNNLLDPSSGAIWTFAIEPYIDLVNPDTQFTQFASSLRTYYSPLLKRNSAQQPPITLALRLAVGSIRGETIESVPADQRFYIGGGGSVRGYEYQSLSPRNSGLIAGGLSFIEAATEIRWRVNKNWGASIFVDGGTGFIEKSPDFGARLSLGGGFGIRYMTSFAPIRLDIAWPISSPLNFETKAQLYVGLKQAF